MLARRGVMLCFLADSGLRISQLCVKRAPNNEASNRRACVVIDVMDVRRATIVMALLDSFLTCPSDLTHYLAISLYASSAGKELSALKSELLSAYKQIEMLKADVLASNKSAQVFDGEAIVLRQSLADKEQALAAADSQIASLQSSIKTLKVLYNSRMSAAKRDRAKP